MLAENVVVPADTTSTTNTGNHWVEKPKILLNRIGFNVIFTI